MRVCIHRTNIYVGVLFKAPENITVGYQPRRLSTETFSCWYSADDLPTTEYVLLPNGVAHDLPGKWQIHTTIIVEEYYAFHLIKKVAE